MASSSGLEREDAERQRRRAMLTERIHDARISAGKEDRSGRYGRFAIDPQAFAFPSGAAPALNGAGAECLPGTAALLRDWMARGVHPGAQLYVSKDAQVIASLAIGWARADAAYKPDTMNSWLCCVKPLLAIAFGQLWERGRIVPDLPIAAIVPEFSGGGKEQITFRHLLSHSASLRPDPLIRSLYESRETQLEILGHTKLAPDARPGWEAYYSHTWAWLVLAEALERIDGRPFEDYLTTEVLALAGAELRLSLSTEEFALLWPRFSLTYDMRETPPVFSMVNSDPDYFSVRAPGMIGVGSCDAMGRIYEALLAAQAGRAEAPMLMSTTVDALTKRERVGAFDVHYDGYVSWGLGFITEPRLFGNACSPRTFGHVGGLGLVAFADPAYGLVVSFVMNGMIDKKESDERDLALADSIYRDLGLQQRGASPRIVAVEPDRAPTWTRLAESEGT